MSDLDVVRVDDLSTLREWHAVGVACYAADYVDLPQDPIEEFLPWLGDQPREEDHEFWFGRLDGTPVVAGGIQLPLHDNLNTASIDLQTHPQWRRRGLGRALLDALLDRVREHGRSLVLAESAHPFGGTVDDRPAAPLARAIGARSVLEEVRRTVDVAAASDEQLDALRRDAAAKAAGYSLLTWTGEAPAGLRADLAALVARMSTDAPQGDMKWDPEQWDADRYVLREQMLIAQGRRRTTTAARHDATGRLVAFTEILVNPTWPVGYQWDTLVAPEHRGHRLGLLVKAANLQAIRALSPAPRVLNTWNAAVNRHMIAINEALGFRPVDVWTEWQLEL
ncbi:MAG TPA: GNAT family N-acetyltransferase, partial [Mycobacteriales bacterium]|nr:GNAT family N-acetyltransferase [Mycobacteriales bacterium]